MKLVKIIFAIVAISMVALSCSKSGTSGDDAATDAAKEQEIKDYNLAIKKEQAKNRFPCDTISLREYINSTYGEGNYLVEFDKTFTYNIPKAAVIYFQDGANYVLAVVAKSKPGERFIESKNVIGFESSFINLDSTKLGTAFFWLTLFECRDGEFIRHWESEVPIHGGFNKMAIKTWKAKSTKYVELNFEDGIISGNRNYNYFMIDGWQKPPHLLETYTALTMKRTITNVNNDKFPDYFEYDFTSHFWEDSLRIIKLKDSIPFYWSEKRKLYITDRTSRWFRKY